MLQKNLKNIVLLQHLFYFIARDTTALVKFSNTISVIQVFSTGLS